MIIKVILLLAILEQCKTAKVLFIAPTPSLSHNLFFQSIIRELCARGHQVVSIAPDLIQHPIPNLTQIDIRTETYGKYNVEDFLLKFQEEKPRLVNVLLDFAASELEMVEAIIKNPQVQKIYNNNKFDLIILENMFYFLFNTWKDHFKCPLIGVASLDLWLSAADNIGNPVFPSFHVDYQNPSGVDLNFWERLTNFWYTWEERWLMYNKIIPNIEALYKKLYGKNVDLKVAQTNYDLVLANTNSIFHLPKASVPALIQIGGLHTQAQKPLPKELKEFLDSAKEGVIYFSLGSNVKSKSLPKAKFDAIIGAFNQLPYQILWKWESTDCPNKPKNVHIQQWLPQQDLLYHPNVKAFVTQGGIQSIDEAIRAKVPMVVLPFAGDQPYNADRIQQLQIGKRLNIKHLTANNLASNLREIIENPGYQKKMNKISDLMWDQPMKPMDKAMWWIEYVIRHKGAGHLRTPAVDMSWFKLLSLDVITFLLCSFIVILIAIIFMLKFVISLFKKNKIKRE